MQNAAQVALEAAEHPIDASRLTQLTQAVQGLDPQQLSWASGYLAGLGAQAQAQSQLPSTATSDARPMTILYASAGGNARAVAESLADGATQRGLSPALFSVEQYRPRDLAKERLLVVVISTQGEGEPPENARELFRFLNAKKAPSLDGLQFAVFGLGDSSYELFCQAGRDLDKRLQALGARPLLERVDADVDFDRPAGDWYGEVLAGAEKAYPDDEARVFPIAPQAAQAPRYDRHHPYQATLLESRRITTADATAAVQHLALEIDPAALRYQPGDALGVRVRNDPALVGEILDQTGLAGDSQVQLQDERVSLHEALSAHRELTQLHPRVVTAWAALSGDAQLNALAAQREQLRLFAAERQFIDLLSAYPAEIDADGLVALLQPLQPRLYSIASSQAVYSDEVHLAVATLQFRAFGRDHLGAASGYLNHRLEEGDPQAVYVAENPGFRLPEDGDTPIIMVGAGTGVAPYRAFLQQRQAAGDHGRNWLVFGNRHFHRDFLYQSDWIRFREQGVLQRASLAFSRDGARRSYVQDRLREEGAEVFRWLQDGARLYVCGALGMERAVRQRVQAIARQQGGLDEDGAAAYVEELQAQGRYLKDVY